MGRVLLFGGGDGGGRGEGLGGTASSLGLGVFVVGVLGEDTWTALDLPRMRRSACCLKM